MCRTNQILGKQLLLIRRMYNFAVSFKSISSLGFSYGLWLRAFTFNLSLSNIYTVANQEILVKIQVTLILQLQCMVAGYHFLNIFSLLVEYPY